MDLENVAKAMEQMAKDLPLKQFKENIRTNLKDLIDNIQPTELLTLLLQERVLTAYQIGQIDAKPVRQDKNHVLMDILWTRPEKDIPTIIGCLCKSNQDHIAKLLIANDIAATSGTQLGTSTEGESTLKNTAMEIMQSSQLHLKRMMKEQSLPKIDAIISCRMSGLEPRYERKRHAVMDTCGLPNTKRLLIEAALCTRMEFHYKEAPLFGSPGNDNAGILTVLESEHPYLGLSAVWVEAFRPNAAIMKSFVERNDFDPNMVNCSERGILHASAIFGDNEVVEVLTMKAIRRIDVDGMQRTLHTVAIKGKEAALNDLLQRLRAGEQLKLMDRHDETAFSFTSSYGDNDTNRWSGPGFEYNGAANRSPTSSSGTGANMSGTAGIKISDLLINDNVAMLVDMSQQATLLCAAVFRDTKAITLLIAQNPDDHSENHRSFTALHVAASYGNVKLVKELIASGADLEAVDADGGNALHAAATGVGDPEIMKVLIESGISVDARDKSSATALLYAAYAGNVKAIEQLVACGAELVAVDEYGYNALHYAAAGTGDSGTIKLFIEKGFNVNAGSKNDSTPLHVAALSKNTKAIEMFIAYGANLHATDEDGITALHFALNNEDSETIKLLIEKGFNVNSRYVNDKTPLHFVAGSGNTNAIEQLIAYRADLEAMDEDGDTALHLALDTGDSETIKLLIERGANVSARSKDDSTPLHVAAKSGDTKAIEMLISYGADLEAMDEDGIRALHLALNNEDSETIKLLIEKGVNVNARDKNDKTPLHLAVESANTEVIELLIAYGADLEAMDEYGNTALHFASYAGDLETIKLLIVKGLNINAKNKKGSTPLHRAAQCGKIKAIEQLIAYGADLEAKDEDRDTVLHLASLGTRDSETIKLLVEKGLNVNARNRVDLAPLHLAAKSGNNQAIEQLVTYGAELEAVNGAGNSALHIAACYMVYSPTIELLIEKGLNVYTKNKEGSTPLHLAAEFGHKTATEVLIANGADLEAMDEYGNTALHCAASGTGDSEIIKLLIEKGANVNARNKIGLTPLHFAANSGDTRAIEQLIAYDVELEAMDEDGNTALHFASDAGYSKTIKLLIERGSNVNERNIYDSTPLHLAEQGHNTKAVEMLIAYGADLEAVDEYGNNALYLAAQNADNIEAIVLLMEKGLTIEDSVADSFYK